jgi:hypothetical protein
LLSLVRSVHRDDVPTTGSIDTKGDTAANPDPRWLENYAQASRRRRARGWHRRNEDPKTKSSNAWAQRKIILLVCVAGVVAVVAVALVP